MKKKTFQMLAAFTRLSFLCASITLTACGAGDNTNSNLSDARTGVATVHCASGGGRYVECQVDGPVQEVRLLRQASSAPCREGHSFGKLSNGVWVNKGCRGDFEVVISAPVPVPTQTLVQHCASGRGRYVTCETGVPILSLQLARQHSAAACRQGQSFGFNGTQIWVNNGCRADFVVTYPDADIIIIPHPRG